MAIIISLMYNVKGHLRYLSLVNKRVGVLLDLRLNIG